MLQGLITDRTQRNVYRRKELSEKGWSGMTEAERIEWNGDPTGVTGVNLLPSGPYHSETVEAKCWNQEIVVTATTSDQYQFTVANIGKVSDYEGKILTLSVEGIETTGGATPLIAAYWHDDMGGSNFAGNSLSVAGSVIIDTSLYPPMVGREYLSLYIYANAGGNVLPGATVRYKRVMLELGSERHPYVPYTEILPTACTKGAYNYSDLNRVERTVAEISDLGGLNLSTRTDWSMRDIPTALDMDRYLSNIRTIRDTFSIEIDAPVSMNNFTYHDANNIEKILLAAYEKVVPQEVTA